MKNIKRIVLHWTAGTNTPNQHEKECYHFLIDDKGKIYKGTHKVSDNFDCTDGNYAPHTGGGNTGAIGIAVCGMCGYKSTSNVGKYPLTKVQLERLCLLTAYLCQKYELAITNKTVLTHYEFGLDNPKTSSRGKIDLTFLYPYEWIRDREAGNFLRNKVRWYFAHLYDYEKELKDLHID